MVGEARPGLVTFKQEPTLWRVIGRQIDADAGITTERRAFRCGVAVQTFRLWWLMVAGCMSCASGASRPGDDLAARRAAQASLAQLLREWSTPCSAEQPAALGEAEQVFVEALLFELPTALAAATSLQNLPELARSSSVTLLAGPHIIASFDQSLSIKAGESPATDAQPILLESSLLVQRADLGAIVLSWELGLQPPGRAARTVPLNVTAHADQLGLGYVSWDDAGQRSLLLLFKTQAVRGEADLRRIFQCKMWQHHRSRLAR